MNASVVFITLGRYLFMKICFSPPNDEYYVFFCYSVFNLISGEFNYQY